MEGPEFIRPSKEEGSFRPGILFSSAYQEEEQNLNFFRGPQLRATRPWIAIDLFFAGLHRLFRQHVVDAALTAIAKSIFDDSVFQRVEADHYQPSARPKDLRRCLQQRLQIVQFAVYENSDCLESSGRRMNLVPSSWSIH
jgi:hypothetical protein